MAANRRLSLFILILGLARLCADHGPKFQQQKLAHAASPLCTASSPPAAKLTEIRASQAGFLSHQGVPAELEGAWVSGRNGCVRFSLHVQVTWRVSIILAGSSSWRGA
jgi:hypothetical protein